MENPVTWKHWNFGEHSPKDKISVYEGMHARKRKLVYTSKMMKNSSPGSPCTTIFCPSSNWTGSKASATVRRSHLSRDSEGGEHRRKDSAEMTDKPEKNLIWKLWTCYLFSGEIFLYALSGFFLNFLFKHKLCASLHLFLSYGMRILRDEPT